MATIPIVATVHAQAGIADFQENREALKQNFLLRGYSKKRGYEDSAELAKNQIPNLPDGTPLRTFAYDPKSLFDKIDAAKLKNGCSLGAAGKFPAGNEFGAAGVVVYSGLTGDAQKDLTLTQARPAVIRAYLVANYGFDDPRLKMLAWTRRQMPWQSTLPSQRPQQPSRPPLNPPEAKLKS